MKKLLLCLLLLTGVCYACDDSAGTKDADVQADTSLPDSTPPPDLSPDGDDTGDTLDCGPCTSPPAVTCEDSDLVRWVSPGTCAQGTCVYEALRTRCVIGCEAAACLGDPCEGVTCASPPGACFSATGTCTSGLCSYAPLTGTSCDDGDACTTDDRCESGVCAGTALRCESSPPARCLDSARLEVFQAVGVCSEGECTYTAAPVTCPGGCADDACLGDPCAGVTCASPPNGCYEAEGICQNGLCSYAPDDGSPCDDGDACTTGDTCQAGTCSGTTIACTTPGFGPTCADANTRRTPVTPGTCDGGTCTYATQDTVCEFGCESGACVGDPCAQVTCDTPPEPSCQGSLLQTAVPGSGVCSGGLCTWSFNTTTCANGCTGGACVAPTGLVISELLYDSTGFPDTDAFLEIHGPPGTALTGVSIVAINGNGGAIYATIPLAGHIGASGLYVVAHPSAQPFIADVADLKTTAIDLQNGPDSVQLRFGDQVLDALAYGNFGASDIAAGEGQPALPTAVNESLARDHLFTDTDDNFTDFKAGSPTPGAATPAPSICISEPDAIVRNGVLFTGDFNAAVKLGGRIEICGEVLMNNLDYLPLHVEVIGISPQAVIYHTSSARGLSFANGVNAHVEAVRIVGHASSGAGQGLRVRSAALVLKDVEVTGFPGGTTVEAALATVVIERSRFVGNRGGPALFLDRSTGTLTDVVFEDNTTPSGSLLGGAVTANLESAVTFTRCTFLQNSGTHSSGGAAVYLGSTPTQVGVWATLRATDCTWGTGATANAPHDLVVWYGTGTTGRVITNVTGNIYCTASSDGNVCTYF